MKKKETRAEFFERNAKAGRTVRFDIKLDMNHLSEAERKRYGLKLGALKIERGTLTASKTRRLLTLLLGSKYVRENVA